MNKFCNHYPYGYTPEELAHVAQTQQLHPALAGALRWLADDGHLTGMPKSINNRFGNLAINVAINSPNSPQSTIAVNKLVEAKDAAIRAWLDANSDTANFLSSSEQAASSEK